MKLENYEIMKSWNVPQEKKINLLTRSIHIASLANLSFRNTSACMFKAGTSPISEILQCYY